MGRGIAISLRLTALLALVLLLAPAAARANSLTTTFTGGNGASGNTFDLEVKTDGPLEIQGFDLNMSGNFTGPREVQVWTRPETAVGHELDPDGWTLRGKAQATSVGTNQPTHVPIAFLLWPGPHGVLIGSPDGALDYSDGAGEFEDAALRLRAGTGLTAPFLSGGSTFSPRTWNGTIYYSDPIVIGTGPAGLTSDRAPTFALPNGEDGPAPECRIFPRGQVPPPPFAPCSATDAHTPAAPLADGDYTLQARRTSPAGLIASRDFTVDATPPPPATLTGGPSGPTGERSPTFRFAVAAATAPECRLFLRGAEPPRFGPCTSQDAYRPAVALADGDYAFEVRAVDAAGNPGQPAGRLFSVLTPAGSAPPGGRAGSARASRTCHARQARADRALAKARKRLKRARAALRRARSTPVEGRRARVAKAKRRLRKARRAVALARRAGAFC